MTTPAPQQPIALTHRPATARNAGPKAAGLKSLAVEPPIKPGTPDPYTPPSPGELQPQTHLQLGPILRYVTALVQHHAELPDPHHGMEHQSG
jgi:hypothetical protein